MVSPIGLFDSGVGGLTVLREVRGLLPEVDLVYLADQAWAPYGERTLTTLRTRATAIAQWFVHQGVSLVVVACNTASGAALHELRALFPAVTFVGMEPAVKPAAETSTTGVVGVLATSGTLNASLYADVVERHADGVVIIERPGVGLVDLVEAGDLDSTVPLLRKYLEPMLAAGADRIVLGCTHYPFLINHIAELVPADVVIVDPAPAVARQVATMAPDAMGSGATLLMTTGSLDTFTEQLARLGLLGPGTQVGATDLAQNASDLP